MSKRYAILGLSVVFALALAVPALGGPSNPIASTSATVKQTANKALKNSKTAKQTANSALSAAGAAQNSANDASSDASKALTEAKKGVTNAAAAQATANTAKAAADAAKSTADGAKTAAEQAKSAADAAEANANTRIKDSDQVFGEASVEDGAVTKVASASCTGRPVLGGGFSVGGAANKVTVTQSEEQFYGGGWFAIGQTISGQGAPVWSISAIAICGTT